MTYTILQGDNRETLKTLADNSIDAIVTDPPYGIDFLGKAWDANTGALETYQECLRVLKPGGHILAFSAARTYHHLAVTLEQAGFEIRDQIMWLYSSGFPKSQDIGKQIHKKENGKFDKQKFDPAIMIKVSGDNYKHPDSNKIYRKLPDINGDNLAKSHEGSGYGAVYQEVVEIDNAWSGWGTALKPAHEPIALARKPMKGSIRDNVQKYGTGAYNIDATRVEVAEDEMESFQGNWDRVNAGMGEYAKLDGSVSHGAGQLADQMKDISGYKPQGRFPSNVLGEIPDYQKYFYCPKVSRKERHIGFEDPGPRHPGADGGGYQVHNVNDAVIVKGQGDNSGNNHPTVKPVALMEYLIKLITPPGGTVLDPFNGSGSTGMAATGLGFNYIGCELDPAYVAIANKRIAAWLKKDEPEVSETFKNLFEEQE